MRLCGRHANLSGSLFPEDITHPPLLLKFILMGRNSRRGAGASGNREIVSHEKGAIRKKWKNRIPAALIYPNTYDLGMSNLGFQLVYHLLNREDSIVAERFFLPQTGAKPLSVESGRSLADFPLIFFSVSFEQDFQPF